MPRVLPVLSALPVLASAAPVPPELFHCIDPNLEVTVWAASPLLRNPTNIDIDQHGRIWVAEGVNYRKHFDREPRGDRIMVLEDTDGDGKADKSWPFVQEPFLRAPLGVAVIENKVVVSMAPDLLVYTDKDGDAVFDAAKGDTREVLLTGFNGRNHDHSLHSVTVGPDGKWYFSAGNCGAKFTDKSGKTFRIAAKQNVSWWPKDPERPDWDPNEIAGQKSDDGRVYVGGFIARMDPDGSNVEILAHNLRNSYENCVTSFGDIFASDNDDQPACRVFWVLEGGNYGFASADGQRTWQADRRPGQSIQTATWRQEDPGVAPAGDIYGGGAPTGCVFYENGALDTGRDALPRVPDSSPGTEKGEGRAGAHPYQNWEGTLFVCESARNTIFGYKPQPDGAGWKLERFDFLTTNKAGEFAGTDFKGGNKGIKADDTKTLFRPSDIAVGADGALYISDWLDPRTGGHADMDDALEGTIYRVAPKGFNSVVPKIDLTTVEGAAESLMSPAVNVRAPGRERLVSLGKDLSIRLMEILPATEGVQEKTLAQNLASVRFSRAMSIAADSKDNPKIGNYPGPPPAHVRSLDAGRRLDSILKRAGNVTRNRVPAADWIGNWALGCEGIETEVFSAILKKAGQPQPEHWPQMFSALAFQLHPPQSIPAFQIRALSPALPLKARLDALTAIGFNDTKEAAAAMLEVAVKLNAASSEPQRGGTTKPGASEERAQPREPAPQTTEPQRGETPSGDATRVSETALWWLLNRKDSTWKSHNLNAALKERDLYDPDKITLLPAPLPPPVASPFSTADAAKLTGDAQRGEAVAAKCFLCHRIGDQGVDYGPDLSTFGRTQTTEALLRSIIEPDADLAHGFAGTRIETQDGLIIEGLLLSESDPLVIRSAGGLTQMVPAAKVKSKSGLTRSLMMNAATLGLTAQEAADVAAHLRGR